jgi:enoyl-[acyl-carrier protein] reductase/trans-2-enoyl-CoA reductase (NAD+)
LYTNKDIAVDEKGRIRIDDWEMREDVQTKVAELWKLANTDTLSNIGDLEGYKKDFLNLFGFGLTDLDYTIDVNENIEISGLV